MKTRLNRIAKDTNFFLKDFLNKQNNSKLIPAMKYGLFPGGKKIRSKILIDIGKLFKIVSLCFNISLKVKGSNISHTNDHL